jgi:hypothetical protein
MMTTYDEVVRREAETKPIRGDANGTKPLGDRKKKYINIRVDEENIDASNKPDIICRMGHTDIVRYKSNGDVVVNIGGWPSATMNDFLYQLLGLKVWTYDNRTWVSCSYKRNRKAESVAGDFVLPHNKPITFRKDETTRNWTTCDVKPVWTHKVNREKSNLVRKSYATFTRYLRNMLKLRTVINEKSHWTGEVVVERVVTITPEELASNGIESRVPRLEFRQRGDSAAQNVRGMMISDDPAQHYLAFLHIMRGAYAWNYMPATGMSLYEDAVGEFYNKLLLFIHKKEVLEKVVNDKNSAKRDPYGQWFR